MKFDELIGHKAADPLQPPGNKLRARPELMKFEELIGYEEADIA